MTQANLIRVADIFLGLSALLHLISPFTLGLTQMAVLLVGIGLFYILLMILLTPGRRWIAYLVFVFMLVGAVGSYMSAGSAVPMWQGNAIAIVDAIAALALFVYLWRPRETAEPV